MPLKRDAVVYQNWLMKRSQMTRMFRRRFTVLTADGKLYSFRRVDLSKPDSLLPSNASLVWDIRGCSVDLAPNLGVNTWVLKPSGSYLKEEIYLRTCSDGGNYSSEHWMRVLAAVAKNSVSTLFNCTPTMSLKLYTNMKAVFYAEMEGSLTVFVLNDAKTAYECAVPVRSDDPMSMLFLKAYTSDHGGETPYASSRPIPQYFHLKSKTELPWVSPKSEFLDLVDESRGVLSTCKLVSSINTGIWDYIKPRTYRFNGGHSFDFSTFKLQIKRMIRVIDSIGGIARFFSDICEWRNPYVSAFYLLYSTVALLLLPRYLPAILVVFVAFYSVRRSTAATSWWNDSMLRHWVNAYGSPEVERREQQTRAGELSLQNVTDLDQTSGSPHSHMSEHGSLTLKSVAKSAVQHVTSTINSALSNRLGTSSVRPPREIWENQRRTLGGTQFNASNLSIFDRSRWSDDSGHVALEPPSNNDWKIDISANNTDDNGWSYSSRWGSSEWHSSFTSWDFVRRRKWVPICFKSFEPMSRVASPQAVIASSPPCQTPTSETNAAAQHTDELVLASLSGIVTNGREYGNIQGDYDEGNAVYQPQQAGLGSILNEFKSTASRAQNEIGGICDVMERIIVLFSWRDELASTIAIMTLILLMLLLVLVPFNVILYCILLSFFHSGFRRSRWRQVPVESVMKQHVSILIDKTVDPSRVGEWKHRSYASLSRSAQEQL